MAGRSPWRSTSAAHHSGGTIQASLPGLLESQWPTASTISTHIALASFPSLVQFPTSLPVLLGSHLPNYLHSNLCFGLLLGEPNLRLQWKQWKPAREDVIEHTGLATKDKEINPSIQSLRSMSVEKESKILTKWLAYSILMANMATAIFPNSLLKMCWHMSSRPAFPIQAVTYVLSSAWD